MQQVQNQHPGQRILYTPVHHDQPLGAGRRLHAHVQTQVPVQYQPIQTQIIERPVTVEKPVYIEVPVDKVVYLPHANK